MGVLSGSARRTWRLALVNAAVAIAVFVALAVSPAPVTFPSTHWEALLLLAGAAVLFVANGFVVAAAAVERARATTVETIELRRLRDYEHFQVATSEGVIGTVAEVVAGRDGEPVGLLVTEGWFGARRFLLPLDDVVGVSTQRRELRVRDRASAVAPAEKDASAR